MERRYAITWWFAMSSCAYLFTCCQGMYLCDSTVSLTQVDQTGSMYSPNFPHDYAANLKCSYKFANNMKDGKVLRLCLQFSQFSTEGIFTDFLILIQWRGRMNVTYSSNGQATFDSLSTPTSIRDSDSLIPLNLFDSPLCVNIQAQSKPLTFLFVSDSEQELPGFSAKYQTFDAFHSDETGVVLKPACSADCDRFRNSPNGTELCECLPLMGIAPPCSFNSQYTCFNERCVENSKTCQSIDGSGNVCGRSDWFLMVDSANTYERARCSGRTFGCNFDDANGLCGHIVHANSKTELIQSTLKLNMIPLDHTQLGGKEHLYGFVSMTNSNKPNMITNHLRTPTVGAFGSQEIGGPRSGICMRFWWQSINAPVQESPTSVLLVLAYDKNATSAKIIKVIFGQYKRLALSINGKGRYQWFLSEIEHLDARSQTYFEFASYMISKEATYYIDDISLAPGPCSLSSDGSGGSIGCSFSSSWCGWSSTTGWRREIGFSDHSCTYLPTSCTASGGGGWLQLRANTSSISSETYELTSPEQRVNIDSLGSRCLTFWYKKCTKNDVLLRKEFLNYRISSHLLVFTLSPSSSWKFVNITLPRSTYSDAPYRWRFIYTPTSQCSDNIHFEIDDIEILETPCVNLREELKQQTPIPTSTVCPLKGYFKCQNGRCIPNLLRCNDYDDCLDKSDETNCSSTNLQNYGFVIGVSAASTLLVVVLGIAVVLLLVRFKKRQQQRHPSPSDLPDFMRGLESADRSCQTSMTTSGHNEILATPPTYLQCLEFPSSSIVRAAVLQRETNYSLAFHLDKDEAPPNYDEALSILNSIILSDSANSLIEETNILETES